MLKPTLQGTFNQINILENICTVTCFCFPRGMYYVRLIFFCQVFYAHKVKATLHCTFNTQYNEPAISVIHIRILVYLSAYLCHAYLCGYASVCICSHSRIKRIYFDALWAWLKLKMWSSDKYPSDKGYDCTTWHTSCEPKGFCVFMGFMNTFQKSREQGSALRHPSSLSPPLSLIPSSLSFPPFLTPTPFYFPFAVTPLVSLPLLQVQYEAFGFIRGHFGVFKLPYDKSRSVCACVCVYCTLVS